jgi:hypothetical protein
MKFKLVIAVLKDTNMKITRKRLKLRLFLLKNIIVFRSTLCLDSRNYCLQINDRMNPKYSSLEYVNFLFIV